MRALVLGLLILGLVSCSGSGEKKGETTVDAKLSEAWLSRYVAVQESLAADDFQAAATAVKKLLQVSQGDMKKLVSSAEGSSDIKVLRTAFKPISEAVMYQALPEGHILVYCPMAFDDQGAHWVQKDGRIMNPYYGAAMLHCGAPVKKPVQKK